jgi:hypothetical protein
MFLSKNFFQFSKKNEQKIKANNEVVVCYQMYN